MFCYLYVLCDRTKIQCHEQDRCFSTCKHLVDGNCSICEVKNERLTHHKFGWILEHKLVFNPPIQSKSGRTKYLSAISLIHPSSSDFWIVKESKEKDNGFCIYVVYNEVKPYEFFKLPELNEWLKKVVSYDGREITEDDFS